MAVASLLILMGLGPWDPVALVIGVVLAVGVFVTAAVLALKPDDDPFPGIGIDDATPIGDTPEHSDAPEDAPLGSTRRTR